jgi:hypothetical protein
MALILCFQVLLQLGFRLILATLEISCSFRVDTDFLWRPCSRKFDPEAAIAPASMDFSHMNTVLSWSLL